VPGTGFVTDIGVNLSTTFTGSAVRATSFVARFGAGAIPASVQPVAVPSRRVAVADRSAHGASRPGCSRRASIVAVIPGFPQGERQCGSGKRRAVPRKGHVSFGSTHSSMRVDLVWVSSVEFGPGSHSIRTVTLLWCASKGPIRRTTSLAPISRKSMHRSGGAGADNQMRTLVSLRWPYNSPPPPAWPTCSA
jgi:hypothetical protein